MENSSPIPKITRPPLHTYWKQNGFAKKMKERTSVKTFLIVVTDGERDGLDSIEILGSGGTGNRPNQEILVPDWLITSHVT